MRIPRIFHADVLSEEQIITLERSTAHYLTKVLRLQAGAELTVFNGQGYEFSGRLETKEKEVSVYIKGRRYIDCESPLHITLIQGISKGERMDITIQKAVELGVTRIIPVTTQRTVVHLKGDRLEKRMKHWQGIIHSACEQCGRNTLPQLATITPLSSLLDTPIGSLKLLLSPYAKTSLSSLKPENKSIALLIGPEGGLQDNEINQALSKGFTAVRMGPRIMRTETAAIASLAVIQALWGDLT